MYRLPLSRIHKLISMIVLLSLLLNSSLIPFVPRQIYAQEGERITPTPKGTADELVTVDDTVQAIPIDEDSILPTASMLRREPLDMARIRAEALGLSDAATAKGLNWPEITIDQPKALETIIDAFPNELPPDRSDGRIFQDATNQQNQRAVPP